jgi:hypothetical protein
MKIKYLLPALAVFFACNNNQPEQVAESLENYDIYGDTISIEGAIPVTELITQIADKDSLMIKLTGNIEEVCQKKGCWMTFNLADGSSMRVKFKDYEFFMPLNSSGQEVIFEGMAYKETTPVNELRHYAEDAGRTHEEIEAITEPEVAITFEASGVLMKKIK